MRKEDLKTQKDLISAFKKYNVQIYNYIFFRVYQNKELAEDIAQEVFLRAWKYRNTFDKSKSKLKTWLYNIASNLLIDHYKSKKLKTLDLEELPEVEDKFSDLDKTVTNSLLKEYVYKKLLLLKQEEQSILTLRYMQNLSIDEIAQVIDKSYDATKVALNRAFKKLKAIINDESTR